MRKLVLTTITSLLTTMTLDASECIIMKDLNVQFKNDSAIYETADELTEIKEFAEFLKDTDLFVLIEGHTNHYAKATYNLELSTKRAEKVKDELISLGVKPNNIKAMGFGESTPLYDNQTVDGTEKNRRVVAEVFNTKDELNKYLINAEERISSIKFLEQ